MTDGDRFLIACTVVLEAEGEPQRGQVAVARVIRTRMAVHAQTVAQVVLRRLQFSAWNHDEPRRTVLSHLFQSPAWPRAMAAVDEAFSDSAEDPSGGASHYLNEAVTRKGRADGSLPPWFDEAKVTARIGRHTFLRTA